MLIKFTNLLHRCGTVDATEVQAFLEANKDDHVFQQRAETVMQGFTAREVRQPELAQAALANP